ncbi:MAG: hypothetical protein K1Y36_29640 [Blastocatellia bacterium]|nr:hypothetical protein [Blastocatellia bacterium]
MHPNSLAALAAGRTGYALQGRKLKNPSSNYLGVSWHPAREKWRARLAGEHLGYFQTEQEAAQAYDQAAIQKYGELAKTNLEKVSLKKNQKSRRKP